MDEWESTGGGPGPKGSTTGSRALRRVRLALATLIVGGIGLTALVFAGVVTVPSVDVPTTAVTAPPSPVEPPPLTEPTNTELEPSAPPDTEAPTIAPPSDPPTALATVDLLAVKGRAPKTDYSREQFGQAWKDMDRNGCDTRNDILARDLTDTTFKPDTRDCVVLTGVLADPYSGLVIDFVRGQDTSIAVQIDHVVALSDAWQKGAQELDLPTREALANDPLNLLAADGPLNAQKSDGDTATWLPPNKPYRCQYVARQVSVKHAYGLWVTTAERDAMVGVLTACPDEPLPVSAVVPPDPTPAPSASPAPVPETPTACDPSYPDVCIPPPMPVLNCGDVPYTDFAVIGADPHGFDGNHDGIACQS